MMNRGNEEARSDEKTKKNEARLEKVSGGMVANLS